MLECDKCSVKETRTLSWYFADVAIPAGDKEARKENFYTNNAACEILRAKTTVLYEQKCLLANEFSIFFCWRQLLGISFDAQVIAQLQIVSKTFCIPRLV